MPATSFLKRAGAVTAIALTLTAAAVGKASGLTANNIEI